MFQRFQILIKSEKNLSVFVYGKSRTNKVNNNYNNIVRYYFALIILPIFYFSKMFLANTKIQSNTRHRRRSVIHGGFLTDRHAVLDFGDHKNK